MVFVHPTCSRYNRNIRHVIHRGIEYTVLRKPKGAIHPDTEKLDYHVDLNNALRSDLPVLGLTGRRSARQTKFKRFTGSNRCVQRTYLLGQAASRVSLQRDNNCELPQ